MNKNWISPTNKIVWIKAFRRKATKVTLPKPDGRTFICQYDLRPGEVLVTPANGRSFVPRGWFNLDKVTNEEWLDDDIKKVTAKEYGGE